MFEEEVLGENRTESLTPENFIKKFSEVRRRASQSHEKSALVRARVQDSRSKIQENDLPKGTLVRFKLGGGDKLSPYWSSALVIARRAQNGNCVLADNVGTPLVRSYPRDMLLEVSKFSEEVARRGGYKILSHRKAGHGQEYEVRFDDGTWSICLRN